MEGRWGGRGGRQEEWKGRGEGGAEVTGVTLVSRLRSVKACEAVREPATAPTFPQHQQQVPHDDRSGAERSREHQAEEHAGSRWRGVKRSGHTTNCFANEYAARQ